MSLQLGGNGGISGCTSLSAPEVITVSGLIVGSGTTANQIGYGFRQGPNGSVIAVSNSGDAAYFYSDPTFSGQNIIGNNYDGLPLNMWPSPNAPSGIPTAGFINKRTEDNSTHQNSFLSLCADNENNSVDAYNGLNRDGTADNPLAISGARNIWIGYGHGYNGVINQRGAFIVFRTSADSAIVATDIQVGGTYQILTVGTSDFTVAGAANNVPGTIFTATGAATGDGTVQFNTQDGRGNMPTEMAFATNPDQRTEISGTRPPVERLVIRNNGALQLRNSPGIDFAAIQGAPLAGATTEGEILGHYEEGTWTPVIEGNTTAGTYNWVAGFPTAHYVRIGKQVTVNCWLQWENGVNGVGDLEIRGLPFQAATNADPLNSRGYMAAAVQSRIDTLPANAVVYGYIGRGTTHVSVDYYISPNQYQSCDWTGSGVFNVTQTYFTN